MELIRTSLNREYAIRFFGVAALFVAFAGWFFYDGKWGYPNENEEVKPVCEQLIKQNLTAKEWMATDKYDGVSQLDYHFQQHNLKAPDYYRDIFQSALREEKPEVDNPKWASAVLSLPVHSPEKIHEQFVSAVVALVAALIFCMVPLYRRRKSFVCDGETLRLFIGGRERAVYAFDEIERVDRSQWAKRGILKVIMKDQTVVTLDAWHYNGVQAIEKVLPPSDDTTVS
jgi:hypothetical protein